MPTLIEIDAVADLPGEVFGPVLHVLRYRREDMEAVVRAVNATGFGLTWTTSIEGSTDSSNARGSRSPHASGVNRSTSRADARRCFSCVECGCTSRWWGKESR